MKDFILIFITMAVFTLIFAAILNSDHIKRHEYRSCQITSTDKALCEDILK